MHRTRSARAARSTRAASWLAVAGLVVGLAGCGGGGPRTTVISVPPPLADTADRLFVAAQATLGRIEAAARSGDPAGVASLAPSGTDLPATIVANARAVGMRDLTLRAVTSAPAPPDAGLPQDAIRVSVQVGYRLGADDRTTHAGTAYFFEPGPHGTALVTADPRAGGRAAWWLQEPVSVHRDRRVLVAVASGESLPRWTRLARRAVQAVDGVLGRQARPLVFEVPDGQRMLERMIGMPAHTYDVVAGVTDEVANARATPIHSFFNADLFAGMGAQGSQLVVSHEAALQATRAPASGLPMWLTEGFADYVALAHLGVPLARAAKQIAVVVRQGGPPTHLPTTADFAPAGADLDRLNATYEAAWLACRYVAQRWGRPRLVAFYDGAGRGRGVVRALRDVLHLGLAQFVAGWRGYLRHVAATIGPR